MKKYRETTPKKKAARKTDGIMCIVAKLWSRKMKVKTKRKYKQMQNRLTETYFNETIE